jgi:uncharacterized glyoxalase superfamily protein PhnB
MMGVKGPQAFGGSPAAFWLYVENSDPLFNRAVNAGAKVEMPRVPVRYFACACGGGVGRSE